MSFRTSLFSIVLLAFVANSGDATSKSEAQPEKPEPTVGDAVEIGPGLEARELTDNAWVVTSARPWSANTVVVRLDDGTVVLADTPPTSAYTNGLLKWVEADLVPTRIVAINGHYHVDGSGGNSTLIGKGIPVWASSSTAELLATQGPGVLAQLRSTAMGTEDEGMWDDEILVQPSDTFAPEDGKVLRFGDQEVHLIFPGASHSPDLIAIHFPELGLLFGGCGVKAGRTLGYLGDADLQTWPGAISILQALEARWVIPGHGSRVDPGLLEHTLDLLETHDTD